MKFGSVKPYLLVRLRGMSLTGPSNRMPKNHLSHISQAVSLSYVGLSPWWRVMLN